MHITIMVLSVKSSKHYSDIVLKLADRHLEGHFDREFHHATCHYQPAVVLARQEHRTQELDQDQYQPNSIQHPIIINTMYQTQTPV